MSLLSRFASSAVVLLSLAACAGSRADANVPSGSKAAADEVLTEAPKPPKATGNPFAGMKLWVDPESLSMLTANSLRKKDPVTAQILDKIAQQPQALWVGDSN